MKNMITNLNHNWLSLITQGILISALKTSLLVGSLLILINQFDIFVGTAEFHLGKAALSYCVPFLVSLYSRIACLKK